MSAIIIPSVAGLDENDRGTMVYEHILGHFWYLSVLHLAWHSDAESTTPSLQASELTWL